MSTYFIALHEQELYNTYGGRSQNVADAMQLVGMGIGIIAKLLNRIKDALKDSLKK